MASIDFRYLIPEEIFNELTELAKKGKEQNNKIVQGWIFADRKNNFAVVKGYEVTKDPAKCHIRPKSWMKLKKTKLYQMRKYIDEDEIDIVYQFHTHPDGKEKLHDIDLKILDYLTTGVMVIVTPKSVVGWYYDKRETRKPILEKMNFEIINN